MPYLARKQHENLVSRKVIAGGRIHHIVEKMVNGKYVHVVNHKHNRHNHLKLGHMHRIHHHHKGGDIENSKDIASDILAKFKSSKKN